MSNFLIDAPRLTVDDLDQRYGENDEEILEDFEKAWTDFLRKNPEKLRARQEKRIHKIRSQMEETKQASTKVEEELQLQLEFFAESRDQLEENFQKTMTEETSNQKEMREQLDKDIDIAAVADHNLSISLPWKKFFYNLDRLAESEGTEGLPFDLISEGTSKPFLPTSRSLLLLNDGDQKEIDMDYMIHAYKVDEALAKAQIRMFELEIERYEKTLQNLEVVGQFFNEHNIWSVLSKGDDGTATYTKSTL